MRAGAVHQGWSVARHVVNGKVDLIWNSSNGYHNSAVNQYYQYADPVEEHINKTRNILRELAGRAVLIMADVNAQSALWHSDRTDERGRELELLVAEEDLEIVNVPGDVPTYTGSEAHSLT